MAPSASRNLSAGGIVGGHAPGTRVCTAYHSSVFTASDTGTAGQPALTRATGRGQYREPAPGHALTRKVWTYRDASAALPTRLALKHLPDLLELGRDVALGEADLAEALNVAELLAALLNQDDGFGETQSPLKQTNFMDHIHSRLNRAISLLVLTGHDDESACGGVKHL